MSLPSLVAAGRRMINGTLVDQVILWSRALVSDGQGGTTETWTAHTDPDEIIACRFGVLAEGDNRGHALQVEAGAIESAPLGALMVSWDEPDISEYDRVVDVNTGRIWQSIGETTPPSNAATVRRILIREV